MNAHRITSCWGRRILQPLAHIVHKQKYTDINFHQLATNSVLLFSPMCTLTSLSHQKYSHKSNSRNIHNSKASQLKDNYQPKNDFTPRKIFLAKGTDSASKKSETSKPPHQRNFLWLEKVHQKLMTTVIFPPEKRDSAEYMDKSIDDLSTSDLMSMAQNITFVNKETMKIIVALWRRFHTMTVEEILTTADIFFHSSVSVPWYNSAMMTYMEETFESLSFTPLQLTRLVFHINNHGSASPSLLHSIEKRISENLSNSDINLVAIICQLNFIGQNRIKSPVLVDKIADKLLEDFHLLQQQYLPMMMKMFRFSNYIKISFYKTLGDILVSSKYFNHFHAQVMHIAFAYASVRITHPQLFESILQQCLIAHKQNRFKDIAKVIWACGTLVTNQKKNISCIHDILLELKKSSIVNWVKEYPDNMMDLLMGLSLLKIYPYDLINIVFDPAILRILSDLPPEREKFFQLHFLDYSLPIECPDYTGFRLTEADRINVAQKISEKSLEIDMQLNKAVKPAVTALENVLGSDCIQCKFLLPHCRTSDILLAYDLDKKLFVKPVEKPLRPLKGLDERVFNKTTQDLVLLLLSRMQTTYDGQPLGLLHCKIRQLQALGYVVITVDAEEALSYACLNMEMTQRLLLNHISAALGVDVSKSLLPRS